MEHSKSQETLLLLIWGQAVIALLGSLFYSEILGYTPCELCWIQRIFMYPLVVIYGVAAYKRQVDLALPGLILSGLGLLVAVYHYGLQKLPFLQAHGGICGDIPCHLQYVNYFGFVSIPLLSLIAFIIIFMLHMILLKQKRR